MALSGDNHYTTFLKSYIIHTRTDCRRGSAMACKQLHTYGP